MTEPSDLSKAIGQIVEKKYVCKRCRRTFDDQKEAVSHAREEHL